MTLRRRIVIARRAVYRCMSKKRWRVYEKVENKKQSVFNA